ncbi:MAG: sigma-70 family RNA polymerase sigma factor [Gemmatimonadota bacterium]
MTDVITVLLQEWRAGSNEALDRLMPLVYDELKVLAERKLRSEAPGHTLQPTALVHEAYARLAEGWAFNDRAHFFAIAARTMRRILVDHARARSASRRGGGGVRVTLNDELVGAGEVSASEEVLALDDALRRLAAVQPRKAQVVELHFFGGLTYAETAITLDISEATVDRDLRVAKAWLAKELTA